MVKDYPPKPGAGLNFLNLFGLTSTTTPIFAALIVTFVFGCLLINFRYPCRSPASLMRVVDQVTTLYNKCLEARAFNAREYGKYTLLLNRVTARTSQIAARTYFESTTRGLCREYLEWMLFLWMRLKDTVDCHRKARLLIRNLEICLRRVSYVRAEYELQTRLRRPQAFRILRDGNDIALTNAKLVEAIVCYLLLPYHLLITLLVVVINSSFRLVLARIAIINSVIVLWLVGTGLNEGAS
ncbi:hypothetical protein L218DRAFT_949892 [Marasmius fiardii PR-910]|nr:hypothetical protein L218DRAFT_949892 [Marasmius fiardii PR-910]